MRRIIAEHSLPSGAIIRLIHGDITQEATDAIVNAANSQLLHGGGVAAAIVRRGGHEIQEQSSAWVKQHGPVTHDQPAVTQAGRLPCRFVIHAVGPMWGEGEEPARLSACVSGALRLASEKDLSSLALPAISTGVFGYPKRPAAEVILGAIEEFLQGTESSSLRDVRVCLFDQPTLEAFETAFRQRWPESGG